MKKIKKLPNKIVTKQLQTNNKIVTKQLQLSNIVKLQLNMFTTIYYYSVGGKKSQLTSKK